MIAARWEHFHHGADIGVRGLGPTKEAAFEQSALALTAVIVDPAEVAKRNPEVIFASWCGKKMKKSTIQNRPGWDAVSAVRDDRIFEIKSTYILQPGPASLTDGVRQLHSIFQRLSLT